MIADRPDAVSRRRSRRRILGVSVDDVTWDEALALLADWVAAGGPHVVVTPNPEIVMRARRDPALLAAIDAADLAPADGVGIRWAGRLLGQPVREVVPGSDLVVRLASAGALAGQRWFLLGGAPGVAERAAARLEADHPGLAVVGTHGGSPRPDDDEEARRRIRDAGRVDVLLVAYGAPGQETWLARNQPVLGVPVGIGVGGTLNFLAGASAVPPDVVRRAGLIWLFRLVTEPWRARRQLALVRFAGLVVATAAGARLRGAGRPAGDL